MSNSQALFYTTSRLPDEVLENVVMYLDLRELLLMRLTSKKWNTFVTSYLPKSPLPIIRFHKGQEDHLRSYLLTLQSRLGEGVAFGSYYISISTIWTKVATFLNTIGSYITNCELTFTNEMYGTFLNLVTLIPNVRELRIDGKKMSPSYLGPLPDNITVLPKLHTLRITSSLYLPLSVIQNLVTRLVALRNLHIAGIVRFNNQSELYNFLNQCGHFTMISLPIVFTEIQPPSDDDVVLVTTNCKLTLQIFTVDGSLVTNLVDVIGTAMYAVLIELKDAVDQIDLSGAVNLKYLRASMDSVDKLDKFWDKNPPSRFSGLRIVWLTWSSGNNFDDKKIHFKSVCYPNVQVLTVTGGFTPTGTPYKPYHIIFPNLKTFAMEGVIRSCHLAYINQHMQRITELRLTSLGGESELQNSLCSDGDQLKENLPPRIEHSFVWALNRLRELRRLTIKDMAKIDAVMVTIAALTQRQQLHQLELLKFIGPVLKSREKLLFHNCLHDKVVFTHKSD